MNINLYSLTGNAYTFQVLKKQSAKDIIKYLAAIHKVPNTGVTLYCDGVTLKSNDIIPNTKQLIYHISVSQTIKKSKKSKITSFIDQIRDHSNDLNTTTQISYGEYAKLQNFFKPSYLLPSDFENVMQQLLSINPDRRTVEFYYRLAGFNVEVASNYLIDPSLFFHNPSVRVQAIGISGILGLGARRIQREIEDQNADNQDHDATRRVPLVHDLFSLLLGLHHLREETEMNRQVFNQESHQDEGEAEAEADYSEETSNGDAGAVIDQEYHWVEPSQRNQDPTELTPPPPPTPPPQVRRPMNEIEQLESQLTPRELVQVRHLQSQSGLDYGEVLQMFIICEKDIESTRACLM